MSTPQLVIGNKTFSDSSLRPWLLLKKADIAFEEQSIRLFRPDSAEKLGLVSPSLKVPVLIHDDIRSWDSLSICEYISETFLEGRGWPGDIRRRTAARSIVAECHSGFQHFHRHWPMNCQVSVPMLVNEQVDEDIARLDSIIHCCRRKYGGGGPYLFGQFSIADCFIAPYCISLRNYHAELTWATQEYLRMLLDDPWIQVWIEEACLEDEEENARALVGQAV